MRRSAEGTLPSVDGPHRVTSDPKGVPKVSGSGGEHREGQRTQARRVQQVRPLVGTRR